MVLYKYRIILLIIIKWANASPEYSCSCDRLVIECSVSSSMESTNHWSCGSAFTAWYSWTKACDLLEVWSSINRSRHRWCGSRCWCKELASPTLGTWPWKRKSTSLVLTSAPRLSTATACSFRNFSFDSAFDTTVTVPHSQRKCVKIQPRMTLVNKKPTLFAQQLTRQLTNLVCRT